MADKNEEIAGKVLEAIGGKDNITDVTHCMTRLRLNLKDESIPSDEKVKEIRGVMRVVRSGGQYQIIIGTNVDKIYASLCEKSGIQGGTRVRRMQAKPTIRRRNPYLQRRWGMPLWPISRAA